SIHSSYVGSQPSLLFGIFCYLFASDSMADLSAAALVDLLRELRLVHSRHLEECAREAAEGSSDAEALAQNLVKRGWLTSYQVRQLLADSGRGLILGDYLLLEPLGKGGMGQVYKARHSMMGRTVALKVIRPECIASPDSVRRFRREIRLAAQLSHPNIVLAYDAAQVEDRHFLVMEYCPGEDLGRLVRRDGPLECRQACSYIRQAALGLQHIHELGIVHRDIKPPNLLLSSGIVKIVDLGVARLRESSDEAPSSTLTFPGTILGTPDFISPEQAAHSARADHRSDLYSLGC